MRPQEIDESNWTQALEQYLKTHTTLRASVREHLPPMQQHIMRELRERLPVQRRRDDQHE